MINQLFEVIEKYASYEPEEKKLIEKSFKVQELKAGEHFIKEGDQANKLGFVVSGIIRNYAIDKSGKEVTLAFLQKNQFVTIIKGFYYGGKYHGSLQAETKCTLLVITREEYDFLIENTANWHNSVVIFSNEFLLGLNIFLRSIVNEDAKSSYMKFLKDCPDVVKRVPLGHICTFLGITQSTLSRIRKDLVK